MNRCCSLRRRDPPRRVLLEHLVQQIARRDRRHLARTLEPPLRMNAASLIPLARHVDQVLLAAQHGAQVAVELGDERRDASKSTSGSPSE